MAAQWGGFAKIILQGRLVTLPFVKHADDRNLLCVHCKGDEVWPLSWVMRWLGASNNPPAA